MIDNFEYYKIYLALKLHFRSKSYDYFKFNGKVRAKKESFLKRRDKHMFYRLGKKFKRDEYVEMLVSNFLINPDLWAGDLLNEAAAKNHREWKGRLESISYIFKEDLEHIVSWTETWENSFADCFRVTNGQHPIVLRFAAQGEISIESFIILDACLNCFQRWEDKIVDEVYWPELKHKCLKYKPFFLPQFKVVDFKRILKKEVLDKR